MLIHTVSRDQILHLLGHSGLRQLFSTGGFMTGASGRRSRRFMPDEDEDEDESEPATGYDPVGPRRRRGRGRAAFQKVPSDEGRELMNAGVFGSNYRPEDSIKRKKRLAYNVMQRELGLGSNGRQRNESRLIQQGMIPESVADTIIHYNARCYSGQFSDDGNFFFSCAQDFKVRMYDTSNPYDWKYYKVSALRTLCRGISDIFSLLYIPTANGPSRTHLSAQTIASWHTAPFAVLYALPQQIRTMRRSPAYSISPIPEHTTRAASTHTLEYGQSGSLAMVEKSSPAPVTTQFTCTTLSDGNPSSGSQGTKTMSMRFALVTHTHRISCTLVQMTRR